MRPLVLASGSPRRAELLRRAGCDFRVVLPELPEERFSGGLAHEYAMRVAQAKAREVAGRVDAGVVLAADTIVVIDGDVLGKPGSRRHARAMLQRLSGRTHTVTTAVTVMDVESGRSLSESDSTDLTLRELSPEDLDWYLETGEAMDKAGAYALQGKAVRFVTRVDGDRETVIGLPMQLVRRLLGQLD